MAMKNAGWQLEHSYAALPSALHSHVAPTPVRAPRLLICNLSLATALGLDAAMIEAMPDMLAGNSLPPGAQPIAQAYAGHQFGGFTILGDGRAILMGEQRAPDGRLYDIQLKGSGVTPYSRRGDGRAALAPMLREHLISEAMAALGIPSTRSLAVVTTGEPVMRETLLPGAVLTRVAASHLRVGTFEYVAAQGDVALLTTLADYAIARHDPALRAAPNPYAAWLDAVAERQARLVALWMAVGFIHGVMNTDNMTISGETIDYGPCAFMDRFDPATVFSAIDHHGRYAYGRQPAIAQWNMARLAEAVLPLLDADMTRAVACAETVIDGFAVHFHRHWLSLMCAKIGLLDARAEDGALIESWLKLLQQHALDYTNSMYALSDASPETYAPFAAAEIQAWLAQWQARRGGHPERLAASQRTMRAHNPVVIPRNHQVEAALVAASEAEDMAPFLRLLAALAQPYREIAEYDFLRAPPSPDERVYQTFCGT